MGSESCLAISLTKRAASAPSALRPETRRNNGLDKGNPRTVTCTADANAGRTELGAVRNNPKQNNEMTAADGADASSQTHSSGWRTRL